MAEEVKVSKLSGTKKSLTRFIKEIRNELKKVIWPTREQLINNTMTVLMACFVVGLLIWVADLGLGKVSEAIFMGK